MGLDLKLLPMDYWNPSMPGGKPSGFGYSHTLLSLPRNSEAWKDINKLARQDVPLDADISSYVGRNVPNGDAEGETMYGSHDLAEGDCYGAPLQWVPAFDLYMVLKKHYIDGDLYRGNANQGAAAAMYLSMLPSSTWVLLYWC